MSVLLISFSCHPFPKCLKIVRLLIWKHALVRVENLPVPRVRELICRGLICRQILQSFRIVNVLS